MITSQYRQRPFTIKKISFGLEKKKDEYRQFLCFNCISYFMGHLMTNPALQKKTH